MKKETNFVYVGNWGFAPAPKGVSIFRYNNSDASLELIETIRPDIAAGQLCIDEEKKILYVSNECGERDGEIGGGGYVYAYKINPEDGSLTFINQRDSLSPEPSYLCLTKSKKYLVVCHCADPFHVTKIKRDENGSIINEVLFDDTALVLFPIEEDGSIGKPCDVLITEGTGGKGKNSKRNIDPVSNHIQLVQVLSRLHSVYESPIYDVMITLDKGMDKIISFRIDEAQGKIIKLCDYSVAEVASFPRYGVFHSKLPLFYANNENLAMLNIVRYTENGNLEVISKTNVLFEDPGLIDGKPVGCQDIVISSDNRTLYVSLSGSNQISVLSLDSEGIPKLIQNVSSMGVFPRCLQISPDGKCLLAGNMISGDIVNFEILEGGYLSEKNIRITKAVSPSAIRFLE